MNFCWDKIKLMLKLKANKKSALFFFFSKAAEEQEYHRCRSEADRTQQSLIKMSFLVQKPFDKRRRLRNFISKSNLQQNEKSRARSWVIMNAHKRPLSKQEAISILLCPKAFSRKLLEGPKYSKVISQCQGNLWGLFQCEVMHL